MNEAEAAPAKGWKYYLGLTLFIGSFASFGLAALVPLLFEPATAATVATGIVIAGEVGFWISAALLGKSFVEGVKAKIKALFQQTPAPPQPISRTRHAVGLVLFSLSFLTYYVAMAIPFTGWEKQTELTAIVVVALAGEAFFLASLFALGGEFWAKLKALYQWPGPPL
jgi:hypothetical protein